MPQCTYRADSIDAPTGCIGKNSCWHIGVRVETDGTVRGYGVCGPGCRADADCPSPSVCQVERGTCVNKKITYAKKPGDTCVSSDVTSASGCPCYFTDKTSGYCANYCHVGEDTCPIDTTCDPLLPGPGAVRPFSAAAVGLHGFCLRVCTVDTECPTGAKCLQSGGLTKKTCRVPPI